MRTRRAQGRRQDPVLPIGRGFIRVLGHHQRRDSRHVSGGVGGRRLVPGEHAVAVAEEGAQHLRPGGRHLDVFAVEHGIRRGPVGVHGRDRQRLGIGRRVARRLGILGPVLLILRDVAR